METGLLAKNPVPVSVTAVPTGPEGISMTSRVDSTVKLALAMSDVASGVSLTWTVCTPAAVAAGTTKLMLKVLLSGTATGLPAICTPLKKT